MDNSTLTFGVIPNSLKLFYTVNIDLDIEVWPLLLEQLLSILYFSLGNTGPNFARDHLSSNHNSWSMTMARHHSNIYFIILLEMAYHCLLVYKLYLSIIGAIFHICWHSLVLIFYLPNTCIAISHCYCWIHPSIIGYFHFTIAFLELIRNFNNDCLVSICQNTMPWLSYGKLGINYSL